MSALIVDVTSSKSNSKKSQGRKGVAESITTPSVASLLASSGLSKASPSLGGLSLSQLAMLAPHELEAVDTRTSINPELTIEPIFKNLKTDRYDSAQVVFLIFSQKLDPIVCANKHNAPVSSLCLIQCSLDATSPFDNRLRIKNISDSPEIKNLLESAVSTNTNHQMSESEESEELHHGLHGTSPTPLVIRPKAVVRRRQKKSAGKEGNVGGGVGRKAGRKAPPASSSSTSSTNISTSTSNSTCRLIFTYWLIRLYLLSRCGVVFPALRYPSYRSNLRMAAWICTHEKTCTIPGLL